MKEIWQNAKKNQEVLYFKNFQTPEITWDDVLSFIYNLSITPSEQMNERVKRSQGFQICGSTINKNGYFLFDENNLFSKFKGVREFMTKVNGGNSSEGCCYYNENFRGKCDCNEQWHIQALRFSITDHTVSDHNDPNDVLYWQLLGTSYWTINQNKEYKLEPGDLLYFNQEDSHLVWQDGPRAGIIIDNIRDRKKND